ncbi:hypothetical protein MMC21_000410 [Puttea exsequens]|nr:hypothetical protein [Puttea exsequens]
MTSPYQRLETLEDDEQDVKRLKSRSRPAKAIWNGWLYVLMAFFLGLLTAVVSEHIRKQNHVRPAQGFEEEMQFLTTPGQRVRTFAPNETFWLYSEESDKAWRSILPNGLGFVQHSSLGPEIVGLAFVHQLHCVDLLHQSYLKAQLNQMTNEADRHTTHCFEYLRNSVICNADPNIEYRNETKPGVFQTLGDGQHQCRNFDEIKAFAEKWRVYNGQTVQERTEISTEENIPGRVIHYDYLSSRGDPVPV